jgi:hypothetical protein
VCAEGALRCFTLPQQQWSDHRLQRGLPWSDRHLFGSRLLLQQIPWKLKFSMEQMMSE